MQSAGLKSDGKCLTSDSLGAYRFPIHSVYRNGTAQITDIPLVLIKEKKTWREALRYCRENHVDLVSVHTEGIQRWVKTVARNASTDNVWVGLRHTCDLKFWFWMSGEFLCYQNWAPGNGTGVEDCSNGERSGAVQSGSKQWISLLENQTLNFICTESDEF
ncbi:snaclec agkicetin-C subunit beta-like [Astyanax mexicanus]|uniref:snaclec agkicetin-C subunit beta-like n=1 Tax=Astyanax mexicanus TaxID=7994 RepID=UPI0020CAD561|nr:snaclec agkicetin-C subunit beta-like [Astyanax mexicanus]